LALNYNDMQFGELRWTPGIVVSHYATTLKSFIVPVEGLADFGAPGQNGTNITRVAVGEKIGQIWGPVFDHVSQGGTDGATQLGASGGGIAKGAPVFKDLNHDGVIDANPGDALLPKGDFKQLGNGIPTAELGWSNRLVYKHWDANIFFRGAFGHSLVNQFRAFYEPIDPGAINSYNRVITKLAPAGLTSAQYSSLYVEKADFLKLDNMTVGYNFKFANNSALKSFRLYVSGQNVFVITKYKGIDPEPVLVDYGDTNNGGGSLVGNSQNTYSSTGQSTNSTPAIIPAANPLSPGIDRRNNYFTARTFTFGINIGF